jgi:flagellar basal body rod protein FlgG
MNVSLYQAASAMNATTQWQDMIAQNLASSSIPGFKKQEMAFSAYDVGQSSVPAGKASGGTNPYVIPSATTATSFQAGEMRMTGVKTDVAIDGSAFFEVQLPSGTTGYTRDGEFQIDPKGQLVTKQGYPVLGNGGPIQLDMTSGVPISVSSNGDVSQGAVSKGKLKLTEFKDPQSLTQISGEYFTADNPGAIPVASTASTVRQGFLEGANTSTVAEMANMMVALRMFQANERIVQTNDDRMSKTIAVLGNNS